MGAQLGGRFVQEAVQARLIRLRQSGSLDPKPHYINQCF